MVRCAPSLMVEVLYPSTFLPPQSAQRIWVHVMLPPPDEKHVSLERIMTLYIRDVQIYYSLVTSH